MTLPDRPGSLARAARALGGTGADIVQLTVLDRTGGRATDDVTLECQGEYDAVTARVRARLADEPGIRLLGIWPVAVATAHGDTELVGQLARDPGRGPVLLVDALPLLLDVDWAALVDTRGDAPEVLFASAALPEPFAPPALTPVRMRLVEAADGTRCAISPFGGGGTVLCVARTGTPPFHLSELERLGALADAASAVLLSTVAARRVEQPQAV